jgi:hypothetical protein
MREGFCNRDQNKSPRDHQAHVAVSQRGLAAIKTLCGRAVADDECPKLWYHNRGGEGV